MPFSREKGIVGYPNCIFIIARRRFFVNTLWHAIITLYARESLSFPDADSEGQSRDLWADCGVLGQ